VQPALFESPRDKYTIFVSRIHPRAEALGPAAQHSHLLATVPCMAGCTSVPLLVSELCLVHYGGTCTASPWFPAMLPSSNVGRRGGGLACQTCMQLATLKKQHPTPHFDSPVRSPLPQRLSTPPKQRHLAAHLHQRRRRILVNVHRLSCIQYKVST
jgi:hypothetical protein